jgi:uncharacterized membrane protein
MWRTFEISVHPPLYHLLLRLWVTGFGSGDFAVRAFSAACGVVAVITVAWAVWRLCGPAAGALAAAFASVLPPLVEHSRQARMYSLVVIFATLTLAGALSWHRSRSHRSGWLYAVSVTATLYTHYYAIFLWLGIAAAYGIYLLHQRQYPVLRGWLMWNALPVGAMLPWLPVFLAQRRAYGNAHWLLSEAPPNILEPLSYVGHCFGLHLHRSHSWFAWGNLPDERALVLLGTSLLWAWLALRGQPKPVKRSFWQDVNLGSLGIVLAASLLPVVLAWWVSQYYNMWRPRYLQICVPGLICLVVAVLLRLRQPQLTLLLSGFLLANSALASTGPLGRREQWRETAHLLQAKWQPGDVIVVTQPSNPPPVRLCLTHYGIDSANVLTVHQDLSHRAEVEALRSRNKRAKRIWLVISHSTGVNLNEYLRTACLRKHTRTITLQNIGIELYE